MLLKSSLKSFVQNFGYRNRSNNSVINKNVPCAFRTNSQRKYCSEKFKLVENESTSVLTIKRTLKSAGVESTEGYSFIKTSCPICDFADSKATSSIYINKVSGTNILMKSRKFSILN